MSRKKKEEIKEYKPSKYQLAIYDFVEHGLGNAVISASAGSGKTYTIIKLLDYIPKDKKVLIVAFNRDIRQEIKAKVINAGHKNVQVDTFHSLGYKILNANFNRRFVNTDPNEYKYSNYISNNISQLSTINTFRLGKQFSQYLSSIQNLVNFGRCYLSETVEDLDKVCERYGIICIADEKEVAVKVLEWGEKCLDEIDYTDMVWLPNTLHLDSKFYKYDWIIVDECQDLNMVEKDMLFTCRRMGTRMLFFGDKAQAIYSFSGADSEAFDKLRELEDTIQLPLSISYRCPKNIVEYVHYLVPTIEYDKKNKIKGEIIENANLSDVKDGDMILCRNNAPLAKIYIELLRNGVKTKILGKDYSANLSKTIRNTKEELLNVDLSMQGVFSKLYDIFYDLVETTMHKQNITKEEALTSSSIIAKLDEIKVLEILSEGLTTSKELQERIKDIFTDNKESGIILSTIHKSKGLESPNVYIACKSLMPSKTAKQPWEIEQENNLIYVAYTRTKNKLGFLDETEFKQFDAYNPETIRSLKSKQYIIDKLYNKNRNEVTTLDQARHIIENAEKLSGTTQDKSELTSKPIIKPKNAIEAFENIMNNKKIKIIRRIKK
jgi:uvrD/REP helicase